MKLARTAIAASAFFSLAACAGYSRPEADWNASATLGPLQGIAATAERAVNNPSARVVGPVGNIGRVDAGVSSERENPVDLTPNWQTSGRRTIGGNGNGPRPAQNDQLIAPRGATPADVRMNSQACRNSDGVVFEYQGALYCRLP